MKKILFILLLVWPLWTMGQSTTEGQDFWVTWFVNAYNRNTGTANNSQLALFVVGGQSASVTVSNPRTAYTRTVNHTAGAKTVIQLPSNSQIRSGQADTMGYHVTSTAPILLYASNYWKDSWDVCNVLPTSALGTEYLIQDPSNVNTPFASELALVATEDSTRIGMILPCPVAGLPALGPGDSLTMMLDRGQSLMLRSTNTGTFMLAESAVTASKPIALFQGHSCGLVSASGGRDLMVEHARPLNLWGQEFLVTPTHGRPENEEIWITAGADNCQVYVDGTPYAAPLSRGAAVCYSPNQRAVYHITTSQPAYVALYPYSYDHGRTLGDPAQVAVNPVERWVSHTIIPLHNCNTNPYDEQYITDDHHYINIVTRTEHVGGMRLNGQPVGGFTALPGGYSHVVLAPGQGAHELSNTLGPFEARGYGVGKWVCYAFEGGIIIDTQQVQLMHDTVHLGDTVCQGEPYRLDAGGIEGLVDLPADSTALPGILERWADWVEDDTLVHHLHLLLTVLPTAAYDTTAALILGDTLVFQGDTLTQAGSYTYTFTAANGCDSVLTLHLDWEPFSLTASAEGICPGDSVSITARGVRQAWWTATPPDPALAARQGQTTITVGPRQTTTYSLCSDSSYTPVASVTVAVEEPPQLCFELSRPFIDFDYPVVIFTDCSDEADHSTWTFGDGITLRATKARRQFRDPLPDSVAVTLRSCSAWDCCADTTFYIHSHIRSVWFPNAFTPGQPTENRFGAVVSFEVADFELYIYTRRGQLVFHTTDVNDLWDGTCEGRPLPQAAYVYYWHVRDHVDYNKSGAGTVTLIR